MHGAKMVFMLCRPLFSIFLKIVWIVHACAEQKLPTAIANITIVFWRGSIPILGCLYVTDMFAAFWDLTPPTCLLCDHGHSTLTVVAWLELQLVRVLAAKHSVSP